MGVSESDVAIVERRLGPRDFARLLRHPPETVFELGRGSDLLLLKLPGKTVAVLNQPRLVEEAFTDDTGRLRAATFAPATATRLGGESVVMLEGAAHRLRRRLIEPLFTERDPAVDRRLVAAEVDRLTARWASDGRVNLVREMKELEVRVLGGLSFGEDYEAHQDALLPYHAVSREVIPRFLNPFAPLLWRVPVPLTRRFAQAQTSFNVVVDGLVEARRAGAARADLLAALLRQRANGHALSDAQARDEAWSYYSQGVPSVALPWILWLVATHGEVQSQLEREADGAPADAGPAELPWTHAAVLESLRLYPPGLFSIRTATAEYELAGRRLPAKTMLVLPIWSLHHDERFWPDPFVFDPGRWLGDRRDAIVPFTYAAFGAGLRRCPARGVAESLVTTAVAAIARSWRIRPEHEEVERAYVPFLRPKKGISAVVERR